MLRKFKNLKLNAEIESIKKGDEIYFKGKNITDALGYKESRRALQQHVSSKYKIRFEDIKGGVKRTSFQPHTIFVSEPGIYELIFSSKLSAAKEFREWVVEDVLPSIRKSGRYEIFNGKNPLVFKMENENDLHNKVVNFIHRFYPDVILIPGLGEQQTTSEKRISAWKKGYIKGQPDLIITNYHKWYTGFCIEFKTPKGTGVTSEAQRKLLDRFKMNGYKILISNDYDVIIQEIVEYCKGIRIPCPHCCKRFVKEVTLQSHLKWFHRIE